MQCQRSLTRTALFWGCSISPPPLKANSSTPIPHNRHHFVSCNNERTQLEGRPRNQGKSKGPTENGKEMKLVWSPETASKAYIDTVKSCQLFRQPSVAELVSAMAAGWNARLIVETWSRGGAINTSTGLAVASCHTGGRHVCIVPDEESKSEYARAMEKANMLPDVVVGKPEEVMTGLMGIDFLVVDCRCDDFARILKVAKLGHRGAVLVCKNASSRAGSDFRWRSVLDGRSRRLVRSEFLPVGHGLDIAHVGATGGNPGSGKGTSRWFKHVDRQSGEEYVIRK